MVLPNSAQKQTFMDKIFTVKVPDLHCISYELEILQEKIFMAILQPTNSFDLNILGYAVELVITICMCVHSSVH